MMLNIIFGESIRSDFIGIAVGHLYYFLVDVLPKLPHFKNMNPLATPKIM
jgi:hypothetical protein